MKPSDLHRLLDEALTATSAEHVEAALTGLLNRGTDANVLTIVANAGVHEIPKAYLRGEVYEDSRGEWKPEN